MPCTPNTSKYWFAPASFPWFVTSQLFYSHFQTPQYSMHGKTVVVTGANVGLGLEASKHFARLGAAQIVLAVRSVRKGEQAKEEILAATGCAPGIIQVWPLDLGSTQSVKDFALRVNEELARVDILLENAGVAYGPFELQEGIETNIKVNVISTYLLAFLLLPKLKTTAQTFNTVPTLTFVSSGAHAHSKFPEGRQAGEGRIFPYLSDKSKANMGERYPLSKLLSLFMGQKMAEVASAASKRCTPSYSVTINLVDPGLCHSELARGVGKWHPVNIMKALIGRSTEAGSRTLVHAVNSGMTTHGQYLGDCEIRPCSDYVTSSEGRQMAVRVYDEACAVLEELAPGCTNNL